MAGAASAAADDSSGNTATSSSSAQTSDATPSGGSNLSHTAGAEADAGHEASPNADENSDAERASVESADSMTDDDVDTDDSAIADDVSTEADDAVADSLGLSKEDSADSEPLTDDMALTDDDPVPDDAIRPAKVESDSGESALALVATTQRAVALTETEVLTNRESGSAAVANNPPPFSGYVTAADVEALKKFIADHYAQIKALDPNNRFLTYASPGYTLPPIGAGIATLEAAVNLIGNAGFSRDANSNLVFTNYTSDDTYIIYGSYKQSFIVPTGVAIIRAGRSFTVPGGVNAIATVQAPQVSASGATSAISAGGPGFPARGSSGGGSTALTPPRVVVIVPVPSGGGGVSAPVSKPKTNPAPKPTVQKVKVDTGGIVGDVIASVAGWMDDVIKLSDDVWADALRVSPQMAKVTRSALPMISGVFDLISGGVDVSSGQHPITSKLKIASGIISSAAALMPFFLPHLAGLKVALLGLSAAVSAMTWTLEATYPQL